MALPTSEFAKRAAIAIALAILPVLVWYLRDAVFIVIGAILIAILLDLLSDPFVRWCRLPRPIGLVLAGLIVLLAVVGCAYLFGTRISTELQDVLSRADTATKAIGDKLGASSWGRSLLSHIDASHLSLTALVSNVLTVSVHMLAAIILTFAAGAYFAAQPALYRDGICQLFPKQSRQNAGETLDDIAMALKWWLLGQAIQMLVIGLLSTTAVWLIGLPSPLALGVIAALTEVVPYLGPIIASVPAALIALNKGLYPLLWTIGAYLAIHQIEGNLLVPLLQRRLVFIPPAAMLISIAGVGSLFGPIAIVFAAPITVMIFTAVKKLYIRDSLQEPTVLPGEKSATR